jgi:hypothetical protein
VQPEGYAFAIWGLIFAWSVALAFWQLQRGQRRNAALAESWPLIAAAWFFNTAWELYVPRFDLDWISLVIIVLGFLAAAGASLRLTAVAARSSAERWLLRYPVLLLAGWLSVAVFANLAATLTLYGLGGEAAVRDSAIIVVAGVTAGALAARLRGALPYLLAAAWGLAAVVVANLTGGSALAATAAVAALAMTALGAVLGWRRRA